MISDQELAHLPLSGRVLNRNAKTGTPGTRYLQSIKRVRQVKREQRLRCLGLFNIEAFHEQLRILTFPSTNWIFEGMLINNRSGTTRVSHIQRVPVGSHTMIVSIEREEAIFRTAMNLIPSVKHGFRMKPCPPYATSAIRTFAIKRYLRCKFEDLATSQVPIDCKDLKLNGAWLDFNGCINLRRKGAIEKFLDNHTNGKCRIVLTAADCRYDKESMEYWGPDRLNSIQKWLENLNGEILHIHKYQSTMPMLEVAADF